jgi:SNF2 family DNA or RNA helicase
MDDFTVPNQYVRIRENPGVNGVTTGKIRKSGTLTYVEVRYGPGEVKYEPANILEIIEIKEDIFTLLGKGRFGDSGDLRRTLIYEKIKGELTNVFYSMESSNTDFFPHQFKPVLKFIESPYGRLLIADEVGLGKTIEAVYIWKELQVRENARRLLIVCPAMLRDKWQRDLLNLFHIDSEILSAEEIYKKVNNFIEKNVNSSFVYIVSIESLRPPKNYEDERVKSNSAKFARILQEYSDVEQSILDLVIIDEAHYLRNPETSNNRLGRILRDAAKNLILLTATPVQIGSANLFNILKLVNPEQFTNEYVFDKMLKSNAPVVNAFRHLWSIPPDYKQVVRYIDEATNNEYFNNDFTLTHIKNAISEAKELDHEKRVEYGRLLESRSMINQFMTRSRKRDVLQNRVLRSAQTISVYYSEYEKFVYNKISDYIRQQYSIKEKIETFALIGRQRQMASCMVAAIKSWHSNEFFDELLWEDFGIIKDNDSYGELSDRTAINFIDQKKLESEDQKYNELKKFVLKESFENKNYKIVIFAFFRETLHYLQRRLDKDGIKTCIIIGGRKDNTEVIDDFKRENGPSILLSSEVGSEGIDLQFCRCLINYDLPWNPMRVEQRIGRLDRLGQKADRITIINFKVEDTIEDRIVMRLYNRINLFKETIGDLEDILGDITNKLAEDLLMPDLTDEEREERAEVNALAIINQRETQNILEEEAVNLIAFNDYILQTIQNSKSIGRWLSGYDLILFIEDFFEKNYPGTIIKRVNDETLIRSISLSAQAKKNLTDFNQKYKSSIITKLNTNHPFVTCVFDFQYNIKNQVGMEYIGSIHPLIQWIKHEYEKNDIKSYSLSSIKLNYSIIEDEKLDDRIKPGIYGYLIHKWSFQGIKKIKKLVYGCFEIDSNTYLDKEISEEFINVVNNFGTSIDELSDYNLNYTNLKQQMMSLDEKLFADFEKRFDDFKSENDSVCEQQEINAQKYFERKTQSFDDVIERFRIEGRDKEIPKFSGLIEKERRFLDLKLSDINKKKLIIHDFTQLACGIVIVKEN